MGTDPGFGANNGNADSNNSAITHLEALLRATDDDEEARDLDLAMSIIQDLDVSLLEPQPFAASANEGNSEELLMLRAMYPDSNSDTSFTELLTAATTTASFASPTRAKRKDKKCTYQNRREEIQTLRDEVVTLESQVRKLKQIKTRQSQVAAEERNHQQCSKKFATAEEENAELKAAILAQKAQLNNLFERMQASKLIVTTQPIHTDDESDLKTKPSS